MGGGCAAPAPAGAGVASVSVFLVEVEAEASTFTGADSDGPDFFLSALCSIFFCCDLILSARAGIEDARGFGFGDGFGADFAFGDDFVLASFLDACLGDVLPPGFRDAMVEARMRMC